MDSLNMRDSAFDPMNKQNNHKGHNHYNNPVATDAMIELGRGLGQIPLSASDMFNDEEEELESKRKEDEEKKKKN